MTLALNGRTMAFTLPDLPHLSSLPFDTVIDVRAPAEFAEDHIPGAISLPVLSDAARAEVGTIYVQDNPFAARKIGAALVARNAATHIQGPLADKDGGWQPLVYCWRGGQRSGSFASILAQIGWRVEVLKGGYQSYRRSIVSGLYDTPLPHRLVLLDGNTGTAKTELLHMLAGQDVQILDLEGLANHRGSVLGPRAGGQPSQKMFESRIAAHLFALDPARPVLVEAESSKVGNLIVPPSVWSAMRAAPRIMVTALPEDRARYLARAYADIAGDHAALKTILAKLIPMQGHERVAHWNALIDNQDLETLARELIDHHYDSRYAQSRSRSDAAAHVVQIRLDPDGLNAACDDLRKSLANVQHTL